MTSIIICTYNKAEYLDLTLAGYQIQSYKDFEVVIVDDGSEDNTIDIVKKYEKKLNIKYHKQKNTGLAVARNVGLDLAKSKNVIITDDDRIPCKDFVHEHITFLDKKDKSVSIGNQGIILSIYKPGLSLRFKEGLELYNKYPSLLTADKVQLFNSEDVINDFPQIIVKYFMNYIENGLFLKLANIYGDELENFELAWSKAYGGNIAFNRALLTSKIKYDSNIKGYGCDDMEFSYQLYLQGFNFHFTKKAINYHQEHERSINQLRDQFINSNYIYQKYPHLETFLMKMDWEGVLSLEEASKFIKLISEYHDILMPRINEYIKRINNFK